MIILSRSPAMTIETAERLGRRLKKGDVVGLAGELGAGKTCFTKGLLRGLGTRAENGRSPTFALMNKYEGRVPVFHFDAYRLNNRAEFEELGYEEYFFGDGISVVEWADKVIEFMPEKSIMVYMRITGENEREIDIRDRDIG